MDTQAYVAIYTLLITTVAGTITTIIAAILAYMKSRDAARSSAAAVAASGDSNRKIDDMQLLLESRMEDWKQEWLAGMESVKADLIARYEAKLNAMAVGSKLPGPTKGA